MDKRIYVSMGKILVAEPVFFGPFDTSEEATQYGTINVVEDDRCFILMLLSDEQAEMLGAINPFGKYDVRFSEEQRKCLIRAISAMPQDDEIADELFCMLQAMKGQEDIIHDFTI